MTEFIDLERIAERIQIVKDESGMNDNAFAETSDIPSSSLSQMLSKKTKVNIKTINKIISRWSDRYNPLWILLGEPYTKEKISEGNPCQGGTQELDTSSDRNESMIVLALLDEINRLKEELSSLQPKQIERIAVYYTDKHYEDYYRKGE